MATDLVSTTALLGTSNPNCVVKEEDQGVIQDQISPTLRSFKRRKITLGDGTTKYMYTFLGTGAPSTTYDAILALATTLPGSKYCNTTTGQWYTAITDDAGTIAWLANPVASRTVATDSALFTNMAAGGVIIIASGDGHAEIKNVAEASDGDAVLST